MLGVVIANGDKQLVIDLPTSSAAMQSELASLDITVPIESVLLSDSGHHQPIPFPPFPLLTGHLVFNHGISKRTAGSNTQKRQQLYKFHTQKPFTLGGR